MIVVLMELPSSLMCQSGNDTILHPPEERPWHELMTVGMYCYVSRGGGGEGGGGAGGRGSEEGGNGHGWKEWEGKVMKIAKMVFI